MAEAEEQTRARSCELLSAALSYAARGWAVFPLASAGKLPLIPSAHPEGDPLRAKCKGECGRDGHGFYDATTNPEKIRAWWDKNPSANVGVRTGSGSGIFAMDVDPPHGMESLGRLQLEHGPLTETLEAATPRGGGHLCYKTPTGRPVGSLNGWRDGIDIKGDAGYIVAAPSRNGTGTPYSWKNDLVPAEAPAWLVPLLPAPGETAAPTADATIPKGTRHASLVEIAARLRRTGLDEAALLAALRSVNELHCDPPQSDADVRRIAADYAKKEGDPLPEQASSPVMPPSSWPIAAEWLEALASLGDPIPTHLPALDLRLRGGMRVGKVFILGGEPGSGKTSLLAQAARRMAASGASVCFWSGDEGPEAIAIRLSEHIGIPRESAEKGEKDAILRLINALASYRLLLPDPDKVRSLPEMFEGLATFAEPRILFLDSIQKITAPNEREKTHEAIEDRMTAIRKLSSRHRVTVFAASEIGRQAYTGNGRSADLASFKGSGGIEFGADVAAVIRPEETDGDFRVSIVKNRIGTKGSFGLRFNPETCLFSELDPVETERQATEDRNAKLEARAEELLGVLREHPGSSSDRIRKIAGGKGESIAEVLRMLKRTGRADWDDGPRGAMLWRAVE